MPQTVPKTRQHLSADPLHRTLKAAFQRIPDHRTKPEISLPDALLSGFAMFSLKDSSLLAFDERRRAGNLQALYGIDQVPSDTQLREILDPVDPEFLRPAFLEIFKAAQRGQALEPFLFHEAAYLLGPVQELLRCLSPFAKQTDAVSRRR